MPLIKMIPSQRDKRNVNNLVSLNLTYHSYSTKINMHIKLLCVLFSAFENSSKLTIKKMDMKIGHLKIHLN